jgi:hypothetical protein
MSDLLKDLIWVSLIALYLTGLIGCIVHLVKNPTDQGRVRVGNPGEAFLFAVFIVVWPALLIAMKLNPRKK